MENFRFVDGHFVHRPFVCACGKEHAVPIQEVIVKPGALRELAGVLDRLDLGKRGLVIADLNTYEAAGEQALDMLRRAGYTLDISLFETRDIVHPDEHALGKILFDLQPGTSFLLVAGSGCLTDTIRLISSRTGIPFVSVATAASMDGYASLGASMLIDGIKKTVFVGAPSAIVADVDVLRQAPYQMTTSGFGDLLGKLNSRIDWQLANLVTGEYYCPYIADLVNETVEQCVANAAGIREHTPEAIATLTEGLILSGLGMLVVGNSRPASGAEHHLAHFWEMKALVDQRPEYFHGTKVGVGTAVIAKFCEKFYQRDPLSVDIEDVKRRKRSFEVWEQDIRRVFGRIADAILTMRKPFFTDWETQENTIRAVQSARDQIQTLKALAPTYSRIAEIQQTVGGKYLPQEIDVDREYLRETLLYAQEVRTQYTVMSVADALGWLDEIVEEVVGEFG